MRKATQATKQIRIEPLVTARVKCAICSRPGSTYLSHRLDPDTVLDFTVKERGETKKTKIRDMDAEYKSCFYMTQDGKYGIPASAIYSALMYTASACGINKKDVKMAIKVIGDIYPLTYKKLNKHISNPRRANGTPDVRHRPEFEEWETEIILEYDETQLGLEQVINLINRAGYSSGIGDWRPSSPKSSGSHGMFMVKPDSIEVMQIR